MESTFAFLNPEPVFQGSPHGGADDGYLRGLRVALQPSISVRDWPAEAGSVALSGFTALEDATVVQRLRQAGAYLRGYTRMSEFGFGLGGGEAGAALAEGADIELVLDLMGESRAAAARWKVSAFKPSYSLVSRLGIVGLIPSMECCGLVAPDLGTIRKTLQTVAGPDDLDFSLLDEETPDLSARTIDPAATTVGLIREAADGLSTERQEAFHTSARYLESRGFTLKELSLPDFALFSLVHRIIGSVEASSATGRYDSVRYGPRAPGARNWNEMYLRCRDAAFGTFLKSFLLQGAFFQFNRYEAFEAACRIRAQLVTEMANLCLRAEYLLLPTPQDTPPGPTVGAPADRPASLSATYAQFDSTLFANVTGQPALYLPPTADGTRPGFQLSGAALSDGALLSLGEHLLSDANGEEW